MSDRAARRLIVGGPRDGEWFEHPGHPDGQVYDGDVLWLLEEGVPSYPFGLSMNKVAYYAKTWFNPQHRVTLPLWVRANHETAEIQRSVERAAWTALGATFHP